MQDLDVGRYRVGPLVYLGEWGVGPQTCAAKQCGWQHKYFIITVSSVSTAGGFDATF